jgi:plastocyanin domain-containing protein
MWEKKAVGEEPMEEVIPGAHDLLLTEFYHWEPSVLVAFEGDTIVLNVSNPRGTVHSLVIPDFGVDTGPLAPKEGKATVEFVADKAGVFPFMCGIPWDPTTDPEECHPDHKYQTGSLVILER